MAFRFLDIGPLVDEELELIPPEPQHIDAVLDACGRRESANDPSAAAITRQKLIDFLRDAPLGHQPADPSRNLVPTYHFWMRIAPGGGGPDVEIAGGINLRVGQNLDLERYSGHIGYGVYPPARGHHYAARACRLILRLAKAHDLRTIWITANPDNWASRKTCERLNAQLVDIVDLPTDHLLYQRGERQKCRYRIDL